MAYRGEDAGDVLVAETLDGKLEVALAANRVTLTIGTKSLHLVDRVATVVDDTGKKKKPRRTSFAVAGIVYARGIPREDIGLWIEAAEDREDAENVAAKAASAAPGKAAKAKAPPPRPRASLRRIFGISPVSLFESEGLRALAKLDTVALRLRAAIEDYATAVHIWSARAVEIGGGHALDKVLFADYGDHHAIYARKLFRDRARYLASVYDGGRVVVPDGKDVHELTVKSRFGVTVRGDYIRFADQHGTDRARISVPWVGPEDREELARRIGALVQRGVSGGG
jgi:hypothetical protein